MERSPLICMTRPSTSATGQITPEDGEYLPESLQMIPIDVRLTEIGCSKATRSSSDKYSGQMSNGRKPQQGARRITRGLALLPTQPLRGSGTVGPLVAMRSQPAVMEG